MLVRTAAAAAALSFFLATGAQTPSALAAGALAAAGEACKADIAKLCPGVKPGGGRVAQCLKAHSGQVSAPCKSAIGQAMADHRQAQGASTAPAH